MGLFTKSNCNYNKALEHLKNAKYSYDNPIVYLSELHTASELLKEDVRKNRGTADAIVVLSNIYYSIYVWAKKNNYNAKLNGMKYLIYATALMHQWSLGWRGYNKNSDQAKTLIQMINDALIDQNSLLTSPSANKNFWVQCHEKYFSDALNMTTELEEK